MKLAVFQDIIGYSYNGNDRAIYKEPIGLLGETEPKNGSDYGDCYILNEDYDGFIKIPSEFVKKEAKGENKYRVEDWNNGESYYFKIYLNNRLIYENGNVDAIVAKHHEIEESNTINVFRGSYVYDMLRAISKNIDN